LSQGCPPGEPTSVRFRYVPDSPFGFLQTSPLASDALAYGLSSRWLGDRVSFNPSAWCTCRTNEKGAKCPEAPKIACHTSLIY
ncbi:MAG: hypothetical protein PHI24_11685, partial [Desulfitobacteriaceae bacterium]|nr:hypothetical protein [Desulfitobacteriaceae bacterium]